MTVSPAYQTYSDADRITHYNEKLASFTEADRPYTRLVFSKEYHAARAWLSDEFQALGLECHSDAGGNLIGRRQAGAQATVPQTVIIGSHIDTVPAGGRYDGIAGVITAMEVVHYLNAHQITLPFTLEVADFLGEELNLWGTSCLGSRHMAGLLNSEMLARRDETGRILGEEIAACGGSGMPPSGARPDAANILACFELHIEQARSLYDADIDIGVVTALPAIDRYAISMTGAVGHSGTTPMHGRKDALVCASGIIQQVSMLAHDIASRSNQHFVATIGKLDVLPNGATIIPGQVEMILDVRSASNEAKSEFLASLADALDKARQKTGCDIDLALLATAKIAPMDSSLQSIITEQAQALSLSHTPLASGAGHDSAHLSRFAPAAMIFIPCVDGLSHCAEELTSSDAIAKGAAVIIRSILSLAEQVAK